MNSFEITFAGAEMEKELREFCIGAAPGTAITPERKLAKRYNIGQATVRRVLNRMLKDGLIIREQGRGTFVAEPPASSSVRTAVYVDNWGNFDHPHYRACLRGLMAEAHERHFRLEIFDCGRHLERLPSLLDDLARPELAGVIMPWCTPEILASLRARKPTIQVIASASSITPPGVGYVGVDYYAVGCAAWFHLVKEARRGPLVAVCLHEDSRVGFAAAAVPYGYRDEVIAVDSHDRAPEPIAHRLRELDPAGIAFDDDYLAASVLGALGPSSLPVVSLTNKDSHVVPAATARLEIDGLAVGRLLLRTLDDMVSQSQMPTTSVLVRPVLVVPPRPSPSTGNLP